MRGSTIIHGNKGGRCAAADLRDSTVTHRSSGGRCAADLSGSTIIHGRSGGPCAAADLRGSAVTHGRSGGRCVADCDRCCGSCSCGGGTQCGMSQNEQNVNVFFLITLNMSSLLFVSCWLLNKHTTLTWYNHCL